ncbi:hypothetical protein AA12717_3076 [Gluconacetobacter sacchari DSM 12717]|nr:hypothetical protein AA12717_3076 [Gluconacetobacter sacchari DSM 12717]
MGLGKVSLLLLAGVLATSSGACGKSICSLGNVKACDNVNVLISPRLSKVISDFVGHGLYKFRGHTYTVHEVLIGNLGGVPRDRIDLNGDSVFLACHYHECDFRAGVSFDTNNRIDSAFMYVPADSSEDWKNPEYKLLIYRKKEAPLSEADIKNLVSQDLKRSDIVPVKMSVSVYNVD